MTTKEIFRQMLTKFAEVTGRPLDGGCDLAVRLYAAAAQLETLYQYADWSRRQAFPQTADGIYLDYHGQMRGLERRSDICAVGSVQVLLSEAQQSDLLFEAGTSLYSAEELEVRLDEDYTLPAGVTRFYANVTAAVPGKRGNLPLGTRFHFADGPACIDAAVAVDAFTGGLDAESDEEYRERILESYRPGPNGANAASYRALALSVENVAACSVIPAARGELTLDLVIADRDGMPTQAQLDQVEALVLPRRELGIDLEVREPTEVLLEVEVTIRCRSGVSLTEARREIASRIYGYFGGKLLGTPVYDSAISHLVYSTGLVSDCSVDTDHRGEDIAPEELPVLYDLTITEAV